MTKKASVSNSKDFPFQGLATFFSLIKSTIPDIYTNERFQKILLSDTCHKEHGVWKTKCLILQYFFADDDRTGPL